MSLNGHIRNSYIDSPFCIHCYGKYSKKKAQLSIRKWVLGLLGYKSLGRWFNLSLEQSVIIYKMRVFLPEWKKKLYDSASQFYVTLIKIGFNIRSNLK